MKKRSYLVLLYFLVFALVFACEDDEEPMSPQLFADFSASLTSIQEGASIQFTDESLGDPTSWEWTFEGGSPSTSIDQNPAVSYANAGVYSVCLLAVNGDNKDKTTKIGYIVVEGDEDDPTTPQLFADFSATSTSIQEGASIQFTDESLGDPTSWEWTFEGGNPSTSIDQNPAVSYAKAGVYSVCLLASNANGKDKTTKVGYIVVDYDLTNGLVAYFPFTGNAEDQSGNSNHGVVLGASLATDRLGNANAAYSFDGVDDFIQVPHDASLEFTNEFTLSAWVMVNQFNTSNCESNRIFEKSNDSQTGSWGLYYDDNFELNNCGDFNEQKVRFKAGYVPTSGRKAINSNTNIARNFWYHVTSTYNGNRLIIYVNGHEEISIVTNEAPANNTADLFIGKQNSSSLPFHLNGKIDEIRIYNRALTDDEIRAVMDLN